MMYKKIDVKIPVGEVVIEGTLTLPLALKALFYFRMEAGHV
jgi:hypothetical protein